MSYDFSGYATKHNIRCSDGRTIMPDAFRDCDGKTVPLVWQHVHDDIDNVIGHATLENRPDGVYAYGSFNSTPKGKHAKAVVQHGDVCALSIYANRLQQVGQNVMHGVIREVSLVLAGANPGATIDNVALEHADGSHQILDDEACMTYVGEPIIVLMHAEDEDEEEPASEKKTEDSDDDETIGDILDTLTDKQKQAVYAIIGDLVEGKEGSNEGSDEESDSEIKHADDDETIKDILDTLSEEQTAVVNKIFEAVDSGKKLSEEDSNVFDTFSDKQKDAVYAAVGLMKEESDDKDEIEHADEDSKETIGDVLDTLNDDQKDSLDKILEALSSGSKPVSKDVADVFDTFSDKQKDAVYAMVGIAMDQDSNENIQHADMDNVEEVLGTMTEEQMDAVEAILDAVEKGEENVPKEVQDIIASMNDEQKSAVKLLIESSIDEGEEDDEDGEDGEENQNDVKHYGFGGYNMSKHNVFESDMDEGAYISHDDMKAIFEDAPRFGSLKEAALQHGITDIEVLFPEAQAVNAQPYQIARRMEWVSTVLNGVRKNPFSRIKSTAVNLTEEQARAKGYIKGRKKIEEQISALRRVTTPQTIYKLQKLDRDDIVDITDFDVVAFMKQEMRMMLDEETARAILVGDGRVGSDPEKIFPDHIRPVWTDDEMYTIHVVIPAADAADYTKMIDSVVRARKTYKGSGNPTMFIGPDILTEMRLLKDNDNRYRYDSDAKLAEAMRVSKIEEVELFDELTRSVEGKNRKLVAVILNLADYTVGADKGGEVTMFDDFDIDYNKMAYLIETRMSGALTMPKSAIAIEIQTTVDSTPEVSYVKVTTPLVADIDDYYEQDEYGRYMKTVDQAIVTGKTYYEIDE